MPIFARAVSRTNYQSIFRLVQKLCGTLWIGGQTVMLSFDLRAKMAPAIITNTYTTIYSSKNEFQLIL